MVCSYRLPKIVSVIRPLLILTLLVGQFVGGRSCCCFSSEVIRWIGDSLNCTNALGTSFLGFRPFGADVRETRAVEKSSFATRSRSYGVHSPSEASAPRRCPKCIGRQTALASENGGRSEAVRRASAFGTVSSCQCQSHKVAATVQKTESSLDLNFQVLIPFSFKTDLDILVVDRDPRVTPKDVEMRISWQARACIWRI